MFIGRVVVEDGSKLPVQAAPQAGTPNPLALVTVQARRGGLTPTAAVRADGTFLLANLDGEFDIRLSLIPIGYWVKSMTFGSIDLTKSTLISGDSALNTLEIRVVLTTEAPDKASAGVTVSGTVVGLPENASTPRWVTLQSQGGAAVNGLVEQRMAQTTPASDGTFAIRHVPPGNYAARIQVPGSPTGAGTPVVAGARDVNGINLSLSAQLTSCGFDRVAVAQGTPMIARVDEKLPGIWIWRSVRSYWGAAVGPQPDIRIRTSASGVVVLSDVSYPFAMKGITIKLPDEVLGRLKREAQASGRSVAALIRERIEIPQNVAESVFALTADLAGSLEGGRRAATNDRRKFHRP
jgi:predicted DNA-binding protein